MSTQPGADVGQTVAPGLPRRLAAMVYDGLLLIALDFLAAGAAVVINRGEALKPGDPLLSLTLALIPVAFFLWFWTHGGQTLGMRAWRLRLVTDSGSVPGYRRSLARLAAALLSWVPLGLGYLWVLVDREHLAWHDRLSATRLVLAQKRPR